MPPVKDSLGTWRAYAVFLQSIIDSINNPDINRIPEQKKFVEWFEIYDQRRHLNFSEVFPEYVNFYNMCKSL